MSQMTQRKQTKTLPYRDRLILSVLLLALSLWSQPKTAQAQWQSGTDMYNLNTGNVGIGSGSSFTPAEKLDVRGNLNLGAVGLTSTLKIYSSAAGGTGSFGRILTRPSGGIEITGGGGSAATENTLYITANTYPGLDNTYSLGSTSLRFSNLYVGTGNSSFVGNVSIGTTNSVGKLHVNVGTNQNLWVRSSGGTLALDSGNDSGSAFAPLRMEASQFHLMTGNIGIGTTDPIAALHIERNTTGIVGVHIKNPNATGVDKYGALFVGGQSTPISLWNNSTVLENAVGGNLVLSGYNGTIIATTGESRIERLRIDSSGNVGIGTTNPINKLQVAGNIDTTDGADRKLILRSSTNYNYALQTTGDDFQIIEAPGSSGAVRLHIDYPNGNVGIGTTTPGARFQIADTSNTTNQMQIAGPSSTTLLHLGHFSDGSYIFNNYKYVNGHSTDDPTKGSMGLVFDSSSLSIQSAAASTTPNRTSLLTVLAGGNVGIGTSSPQNTLHLDTSAGPVIRFTRTGFPSAFKIDTDGSSGAIATDTAHPLVFRTNSVERLRIDSNGNVGIGTPTPGTTLEVVGEGISVDRANGTPFLAFKGSGVNKAAIYSNNNGDLRFFSGSGTLAENVTIKNDGKVGIGTQGPSEMLHVTGNVRVDGNIAAKYQDVAEWVTSPKSMSAGTVVILDAEYSNQVLPSVRSYDTRVAGVISERPGLLLGEAGDGKVKVATTGRVKVKVDATKGAVQVGDLLVTSDKEGVAMKSEPLDLGGVPIHRPGTLIGKALEPLSEGEGEILVLLSLQ